MRYQPPWLYAQSAVVPYHLVGDLVEVLLITSRRAKRWTIPKGVIEPTLTPQASAAKEAYEEAGVRGLVGSASLGAFEYEKWGGTCRVEVFPLLVQDILETWPESDRRQRRWVTIESALELVRSEGVRDGVLALASRLRQGDS